jgi:hypothetical protein
MRKGKDDEEEEIADTEPAAIYVAEVLAGAPLDAALPMADVQPAQAGGASSTSGGAADFIEAQAPLAAGMTVVPHADLTSALIAQTAQRSAPPKPVCQFTKEVQFSGATRSLWTHQDERGGETDDWFAGKWTTNM